MPHRDVPAFMMQLRALKNDPVATALRFTILTAARAGETLKANWQDFDLKARVWRIPPAKQKSRREHVTVLSGRALAILAELEGTASGRVFPIEESAMLRLLRK